MSDPTYRYFENPHAYAAWTEEARDCPLCGRRRPGYEGPFLGEEDIDFVCEECLASGALADEDMTTNIGDMESLREQLQALHPEAGPHDVAAMVEERYAELAEETPRPVTWQDFLWPAHCGDFCRYVKEVGQEDLKQLAPDGDGCRFFLEHLAPDLRERTGPEVYDRLRRDSPRESRHGLHETAAYLFRCLECGTPILLWDAS